MVYYGSGTNQYSITPNFGEGIVIKEIEVPAAVSDYLMIYIGKTLVGFYSVGANPIGNNLFAVAESVSESNLYSYLVKSGVFRPYRVAEGETITFKTKNGTPFELFVVYETYEAGDIRPDEPNGSKSEEYDFVNYVTVSAVDLESIVDATLSPTEFPSFPAGADVPAGREILIHGIVGIPVYAADAASNPTNVTRTKAIKFTYNRKVLFDEAKVGIPFLGVGSASATKYYGAYLTPISPCSDKDRREVFLFPEPLVFAEGEELEMKIVLEQIQGEDLQLTAGDLVLGLIETVKVGR